MTALCIMHNILCIMHNITFFTQNQAQVLAILLGRSEGEYSLSDLGNIVKKHPGVFKRGVDSLEKQGIILSRKKDNRRFFRINDKNPFFNEIKGIVEKSVGVRGLLEDLVKDIKGISIALIYGSYASGKMRSDSDIDLLIVLNAQKAEDILIDRIRIIEDKLQREINYKVYGSSEFLAKREKNDPFLAEVLSGKYILLKGKV